MTLTHKFVVKIVTAIKHLMAHRGLVSDCLQHTRNAKAYVQINPLISHYLSFLGWCATGKEHAGPGPSLGVMQTSKQTNLF